MIGHSLGEYVAATLAGVFELEDALALVAERARLMQQMPSGSMLAVHLSEDELAPWLSKQVSLAAINAPGLSVISGPTASINGLADALRRKQVEVQPLLTSHAFHSAMMEPMIEELQLKIARTKRNVPQLPFLSTLTGTWITDEQAASPSYWGQQTRCGVRFSPAILELLKNRGSVLLEVGPGNSLTTLAKLHLSLDAQSKVVNSLPHAKENRSDLECMLTALGSLWVSGISIDWKRFGGSGDRRRVPLPSYPFERQRFWVKLEKENPQMVNGAEAVAGTQEADEQSPKSNLESPNTVQTGIASRNDVGIQYASPRSEIENRLAKLWQEVLGLQQVGSDENFFELGGQSLMAVTLVTETG